MLKRVCCLLIITLVLTMLVACSSKPETTAALTTRTSTASPTQAPSTTTSAKPTGIPVPQMTVWYRENENDDVIGPDLPAGDYILAAAKFGENGVAALYEYDSDGERKGKLIKRVEFPVCTKISVTRGQVLISQKLRIYKAADLAPAKSQDGSYLIGLYEVGKDIPVGTYIINAYEKTMKDWTHFAVMRDLDNQDDSLVQQIQIDPLSPITVELANGQFIYMQNVYAKVKN